MGFEQLASLKDQLAKQAKQAQQAKQAPKAAVKPPPAPPAAKKRTEPVDPVVLTIGQLQKRFPKVFPKSPAPKIALKLGVHKDLLAQAQTLGLTEQALLDAIKTWCRGTRYWAAIVEGAVRVDLAGEEAGRVLPTEAARARSLEANRHRKTPPKKAHAAPQVKAQKEVKSAQEVTVAHTTAAVPDLIAQPQAETQLLAQTPREEVSAVEEAPREEVKAAEEAPREEVKAAE